MKDPDQDPTVEHRPTDGTTFTGWGGAVPDPGRLSSELVPGATFGRFRIGRRLGQGGMGEVFEADDLDSGRRVALKILARPAFSQTERSRFLREGRLAASINHPNCVYVFGTEEIGGRPVIAMELVPEGTLRDRVLAKGPLEPATALEATLQVIAGLEAAHDAGVLHRDVKPSNCFLDGRGGVKVGDFGLSVSSHGREEETQLTVAGMFLGTPAYASPEQLRGQPLDARSDIYAVGATLYYLLTGRAPFEEPNPVTLVASILQAEPQSPATLRADVPPGLGRVVLRCLAKAASARYQSYAELREALAPFARTRQAPAELRLRLAAWLVDYSPWFFFSTVVSLWRVDILGWLWVQLASLGTSALYLAAAEGVWGAGVGKRLLGIRVTGPDGQAPGLARATLRALMFLIVPAVPNLVTQAVTGGAAAYWEFMSTGPGRVVALSGVALSIGLFATARRGNGFAGLHELASRTRVVHRQASVSRPQMREPIARGAGVSDAPERIGPYQITGALDADVLVGLEPALGREVWIRRGSPGEPAVSQARREIDRATRLRWQSGRRTATESWDAFEAPPGVPLAEVLQRPQPWSAVRHWLLDVAEEIAAGERDHTLPDELGLAHVWITPHGGARLIDFPVGPASPGTPSGTAVAAGALLQSIAHAALSPRDGAKDAPGGTVPQIPVPLHARALLEDLSSDRVPELAALIERLRRAVGEAPVVGRTRRVAHLLSANIMVVLSLIPALLVVRLVMDARLADMQELKACMKALSAAETATEREATEIYVAGRFAAFSALARQLRDSPSPFSATANPDIRSNMVAGVLRGTLDPPERELLVSIFDRHHSPSPEAVREAEQRLSGQLRERLERIRAQIAKQKDPDRLPGLCGLAGTMLVCGWGALLALGSTLFRGGPLLSLFGIAIVTRTGARASRLRLLGRGLALWLPFGLCLLVSVVFVELGEQHDLPPGLRWGSLALLATIPVAALVACALSPTRGPHDRVAGTYLVPR